MTEKVLLEAEVVQTAEEWIMVRFPRIGHHPPSNVRVPIANVVKAKPKARL